LLECLETAYLKSQVDYAGSQRPYSADLTSLPNGHGYEVRVRAVDHNYGNAFVSPSITVQSSQQCSKPPRSPPRGVEVSPIGPTQIRLSWQPLSDAEWNCDRVWYVVMLFQLMYHSRPFIAERV